MSTHHTRRALIAGGGAVLVGSFLVKDSVGLAGDDLSGTPSAAATPEATPENPSGDSQNISTVGNVQLTRIHHDQNLLPDREHSGFSSLLFDSEGKLVLHDGDKTWLYTTSLFEEPEGDRRDWYGKWISHVREFDTRTFVSGERKVALGLAGDDQWAVIHDVVKASDDLYVAFYSTNGGVRAAVSDRPDGLFEADPDFQITVTEPWEERGGGEDSLESTGGHVKIDESDASLSLWLLYDSYHVDVTRGLLGWAEIRIDKRAKSVELLGKHEDNPLEALPEEDYIAARAGGNVSTDVRLDDKYALFYYTRPDTDTITLTVALSTDPLFQDVTDIAELEPPLGAEEVIEKFQAYMVDDILHIIYENKLESDHWGTGIRLYEVTE